MCNGICFSFQVNGTEIEYEFEEITLERVSQSGGPLTDSVTQLWACTHFIHRINQSVPLEMNHLFDNCVAFSAFIFLKCQDIEGLL